MTSHQISIFEEKSLGSRFYKNSQECANMKIIKVKVNFWLIFKAQFICFIEKKVKQKVFYWPVTLPASYHFNEIKLVSFFLL